MKRRTGPWVRKAEEDVEGARLLANRNPPLRHIACFYCQQAVEKYLKALLLELGVSFPLTHDLERLLGLLVPYTPPLNRFRHRLAALTEFGREFRDPFARATLRQMQSALRTMERVRSVVRPWLELPE
jgi:HEPN domain-containing protein